MKKRGPSTEPWGTPRDRGAVGGGAVVDKDELFLVSKTWLDPGEDIVCDGERRL